MTGHTIRAALATWRRAAHSNGLGGVRMKLVMMNTVEGRPIAI